MVNVVGGLRGICESVQWWLLGWVGLGWAEVLLGGVLSVRTEWVVVVVVVVMSVVLVVMGRGCLHVWGSVGERGGVYICIHLQGERLFLLGAWV